MIALNSLSEIGIEKQYLNVRSDCFHGTCPCCFLQLNNKSYEVVRTTCSKPHYLHLHCFKKLEGDTKSRRFCPRCRTDITTMYKRVKHSKNKTSSDPSQSTTDTEKQSASSTTKPSKRSIQVAKLETVTVVWEQKYATNCLYFDQQVRQLIPTLQSCREQYPDVMERMAFIVKSLKKINQVTPNSAQVPKSQTNDCIKHHLAPFYLAELPGFILHIQKLSDRSLGRRHVQEVHSTFTLVYLIFQKGQMFSLRAKITHLYQSLIQGELKYLEFRLACHNQTGVEMSINSLNWLLGDTSPAVRHKFLGEQQIYYFKSELKKIKSTKLSPQVHQQAVKRHRITNKAVLAMEACDLHALEEICWASSAPDYLMQRMIFDLVKAQIKTFLCDKKDSTLSSNVASLQALNLLRQQHATTFTKLPFLQKDLLALFSSIVKKIVMARRHLSEEQPSQQYLTIIPELITEGGWLDKTSQKMWEALKCGEHIEAAPSNELSSEKVNWQLIDIHNMIEAKKPEQTAELLEPLVKQKEAIECLVCGEVLIQRLDGARQRVYNLTFGEIFKAFSQVRDKHNDDYKAYAQTLAPFKEKIVRYEKLLCALDSEQRISNWRLTICKAWWISLSQVALDSAIDHSLFDDLKNLRLVAQQVPCKKTRLQLYTAMSHIFTISARASQIRNSYSNQLKELQDWASNLMTAETQCKDLREFVSLTLATRKLTGKFAEHMRPLDDSPKQAVMTITLPASDGSAPPRTIEITDVSQIDHIFAKKNDSTESQTPNDSGVEASTHEAESVTSSSNQSETEASADTIKNNETNSENIRENSTHETVNSQPTIPAHELMAVAELTPDEPIENHPVDKNTMIKVAVKTKLKTSSRRPQRKRTVVAPRLKFPTTPATAKRRLPPARSIQSTEKQKTHQTELHMSAATNYLPATTPHYPTVPIYSPTSQAMIPFTSFAACGLPHLHICAYPPYTYTNNLLCRATTQPY